jgi:hypothetical protein
LGIVKFTEPNVGILPFTERNYLSISTEHSHNTSVLKEQFHRTPHQDSPTSIFYHDPADSNICTTSKRENTPDDGEKS